MLANAEYMPLADSSFDIVSCHYLFHEVPAHVRQRIAREIARVAWPDALILFVDSIQPGDEPAYDGLLERFPQSFHEPYFLDYMREDLETLFAKVGLDTESVSRAFFSRVMVLRPRPRRRKRPKPRQSSCKATMKVTMSAAVLSRMVNGARLPSRLARTACSFMSTVSS